MIYRFDPVLAAPRGAINITKEKVLFFEKKTYLCNVTKTPVFRRSTLDEHQTIGSSNFFVGHHVISGITITLKLFFGSFGI
jgi:hypothetical protein